jgi:hypothetical protein
MNEIMANFDPEEFTPYKLTFERYKFLEYVQELLNGESRIGYPAEYLLRESLKNTELIGCGCESCRKANWSINQSLNKLRSFNLSINDMNIAMSYINQKRLENSTLNEIDYEYALKRMVSPCGCG